MKQKPKLRADVLVVQRVISDKEGTRAYLAQEDDVFHDFGSGHMWVPCEGDLADLCVFDRLTLVKEEG